MLGSRAPGFQVHNPVMVPAEIVYRCRVREGTHVEAGFPWTL
jgi:hypothetical protein